MRYLPYILLLSFAFISCATVDINNSYGMGENENHFNYNYTHSNINLKSIYENVSFYIRIDKDSQESPVQGSKYYIYNAIKKELLNQNAKITNSSENSEISYQIIFSKYITQKYDLSYFITEIDLSYIAIDNIENNIISKNVLSISGEGRSPGQSNNSALQNIFIAILKDSNIIRHIQNSKNGSRNNITIALDRLSNTLIKDFEQLVPLQKVTKVAFAGFKTNSSNSLSQLFTTSLKKYWKHPKYKFYTRQQLDLVLSEYSLQLSGLINESSVKNIGKLKAIDYLITGNLINYNHDLIVEAQVINVIDAEVISSKSTTLKIK